MLNDGETASLSIQSSASRERVALQFTMPLGGVLLCVCVVLRVIAESLLFLPVTVNNSKQWQPRWSSCICSWRPITALAVCVNVMCS